MPHVNNNGVHIEYRLFGQGEPLVLIHGWSCEGRYWDEFGYLRRLSGEFTVIVPDLRGHGCSGVPANRDFSDEAFASDVVAVLDDLGIHSAHVFGYSLGGWIVFELAANSASRIRTMMVGGAHPYAEDLAAVRNFSPGDLVNAWDAVGAPLSEDSRNRIFAFDQPTLAEMVPDRIDKAGRLNALALRCLMVCGTDDLRFADMRRFAAGNVLCEFVPVEAADHLQAWLQSDRIVPVLQAFLHATVQEAG